MIAKPIYSIALSIGLIAISQARPYSFTTAEGFRSGKLDGQLGWTAYGNAVDAGGSGKALLDTESWKVAFAGDVLSSVNTQFVVSAVFTFSEVNKTGSNDIISLLLNDRGDKGKIGFRAYLTRKKAAGRYAIELKNDTGVSGGTTEFSAGLLGFAKSPHSAQLKLTMELTKQTASGTWGFTLTLKNQTDGKLVATSSGSITGKASMSYSDLYGGFSSSRDAESTGTTDRAIEWFEATALPEHATLGLLY